MNPNNDPELSAIPIPILEFINVSFIEKDTIEVKFGDLFGSEKINVNFTAIDFVPSARRLYTLLDVDINNLQNGQILKYDAIAQKWKNVNP